MKLRASLTFRRYHGSLSTRLGYPRWDEGRVRITAWEWGVGKGGWKRRINRRAKEVGADGRLRAIYFLVGCRYSGTIQGTKKQADLVWAALRG